MPATSGRKTANPAVGFFVRGDYATGSTVKIARTSCSTSSACREVVDRDDAQLLVAADRDHVANRPVRDGVTSIAGSGG